MPLCSPTRSVQQVVFYKLLNVYFLKYSHNFEGSKFLFGNSNFPKIVNYRTDNCWFAFDDLSIE